MPGSALLILILISPFLDTSEGFFFGMLTPRAKTSTNSFDCLSTKNTTLPRKFCDGVKDCPDGSDELQSICGNAGCGKRKQDHWTSCDNIANTARKTCFINRKYICQGRINCQGKTPCTEGCLTHFVCPDGECKKRATVCNSNTCDDCKGFDNWKSGHGFKCARNGGKCNLPQVLLHDGVKDCDDGSDMCYAADGGPLTNNISDIRNSTFARFNSSLCFRCLDQSMIVARSSVCDGVIDCPDMTDECLCEGNTPAICSRVQSYTAEIRKTSNCPVGDLVCSDGSCVKRNKVCDGIVDCKDAMDEQFAYCKGTIPCNHATVPGEICRCSNMAAATCLQTTGKFCDDKPQCLSRLWRTWFVEAPENECSGQCRHNGTNWKTWKTNTYNCTAAFTKRKAKSSSFRCLVSSKRRRFRFQRKTIKPSQICDGIVDCPRSFVTDESPRYCGRRRYFCKVARGLSISKHKVCDGFEDCTDKRDEKISLCGKPNRQRYYCPALGGTKVSISTNEVCDFTINCDDATDELNCTADGRFYCENKQPLFVKKRKMFNGVADCTDWSDECPTTTNVTSDNVFSSRYELIANPILRGIVWIMGMLAIGGNIVVFVNEVHTLYMMTSSSASLRTNHMLVLNLAVADMLMGVYLIMLGIAGVRYQGSYCAHDLHWRSSTMCTVMGILVVLSSETSMLTMVLLTVCRLYAVYNPINAAVKPQPALVGFLIFISWGASFLLALLPLHPHFDWLFSRGAWLNDFPFFHSVVVRFSSFKAFANRLLTFGTFDNGTLKSSLVADVTRIKDASSWKQLQNILADEHSHHQQIPVHRYFGYYSKSTVCVPKLLITTEDKVWGFSFSITLFNFLAFCFVASAYIVIYMKSTGQTVGRRRSTRDGGKQKKKISKKIKTVQRKIFRLVLTDFCCWVPISILAFLSLGGVKLAPVAYAVTAIVLLPINSALNPIVYSNFLDKLSDLCRCAKAKKKDDVSTTTSNTFIKKSEKASLRKTSSADRPENVYETVK